MTYHPDNHHVVEIELYKNMRDFYFFVAKLDWFAEYTGKLLEAKKKAQIWELTNQLSRPINWNRGR